MKVRISTKDVKREYDIENHFQAIKSFFSEIKNGKIALDELGLIGYCVPDNDENRPFRIPPSLYSLGLIDKETLEATLAQIAPMNWSEIEKIIKADKWMVEEVVV